jgi:hypothetical protein
MALPVCAGAQRLALLRLLLPQGRGVGGGQRQVGGPLDRQAGGLVGGAAVFGLVLAPSSAKTAMIPTPGVNKLFFCDLIRGTDFQDHGRGGWGGFGFGITPPSGDGPMISARPACGVGPLCLPVRPGPPGRRPPGRVCGRWRTADTLSAWTVQFALGHLPHAHQRVRTRPQHQLLQVPDLGPVTCLRRLEDPAPQPPYLLLPPLPADGFPPVSVSASSGPSGPFTVMASNLPFRESTAQHRRQRLTCPRQHPHGLQAQRPGIRPVIRGCWRRSQPCHPLSCCLSATGIRFLGILFPPGTSAPLTVGLPPPRRREWRTLAGFPRSARMRHS